MRYIRTKDGRIIATAKKSVALGYHPVEADSIEELCDYVFLYDSQNELVIIDLKKTNLYCLKGSLKDGSIRDVKLAIITDKGLIYVAKMNEKGDIVLL